MVVTNISYPEKIDNSAIFNVVSIYPIYINCFDSAIIKRQLIINDNETTNISAPRYVLTFALYDDNDNSIFINTVIDINHKSSSIDIKFLNKNPITMFDINGNLRSNFKNKEILFDHIGESDTNNTYFSDLKISVKNNEYIGYAYNIINENINYIKMKFSKECFVKLNIFFTRFLKYDTKAQEVFYDKKLDNLEFCNINAIYLDCSSTDKSTNIVMNHYTAISHRRVYEFNFISPKIKDKELKKPIKPEKFSILYGDNFLISNMFYRNNEDEDCLYIIFELRSEYDKYIKTIVLLFNKEIYNKANFIDFNNIYKENNDGREC